MLEIFLTSLNIMLYGMIGIFLIIGLIFLTVFILSLVFKPKPEDSEPKTGDAD